MTTTLLEARPLSPSGRPGLGYGLWTATVRTADGRTCEGGGRSREEAIRRAELRAAGEASQL